ncbi:MAG: hypothetical protein JO326_07860 [Acetobacteraceae bacterium]|nr:hypothetical protein [Acetobacteraceae bacterium]
MLAVVLLGLLVMILRRQAAAQLAGFLSMLNGVMLAALELAAMPTVLTLTVVALTLISCAVLGVFSVGIRRIDGGRVAA